MQIITNNISDKPVGAVILAAGESKRMNRLKPFLPFDDKVLFIDKILETYLSFGVNEIVVVISGANEKWKEYKTRYSYTENVNFIENTQPDYERFYSVKLGLSQIRHSKYYFLQNIDNPFIDTSVLNLIYELRSDYCYVVPNYNGIGGHPVLLNREIKKAIHNLPDFGQNLKEVLKNHRRCNVQVASDTILININTQEDYKHYFDRDLSENIL